jgi:hypothetical protein
MTRTVSHNPYLTSRDICHSDEPGSLWIFFSIPQILWLPPGLDSDTRDSAQRPLYAFGWPGPERKHPEKQKRSGGARRPDEQSRLAKIGDAWCFVALEFGRLPN